MLCFFAAIRYRFLIDDNLNKKNEKEIKKEEEELERQSSIVRYLRDVSRFTSDIYQYYMIWIYHILFNFILIHDHKDLLSTILFVVESITLIVHVILWKRGKTNDYANMYKTWYLTFVIVIFYAFIRYLLFFLKYSTINYFLKENPTIRKICYNVVAQELLDREMGVINHAYVLKNYICPLLLLSLGVLTRNAFSKNFNIRKEMNQISSNLGIKKTKRGSIGLNLSSARPRTNTHMSKPLEAIAEEEDEKDKGFINPKLIDSDASDENSEEEKVNEEQENNIGQVKVNPFAALLEGKGF